MKLSTWIKMFEAAQTLNTKLILISYLEKTNLEVDTDFNGIKDNQWRQIVSAACARACSR
jgi:hypothetical protein